jgi:hypothetical protein
MKTLINRLYSDYAMPSRLGVYEDFVRSAKRAGYTQTSVRQFFHALRERPGRDTVVIHRHDIDTDLRTARKMFDIEKKHNIRSSFYFRTSTLDFPFMREIEDYGSEASYHYEELSTFAKQHKIRSRADMHAHLPEIRAQFVSNVARIEQGLGRKISTVASHGDFANRRLGMPNTVILDDPQLRQRCGITCETYDSALLDAVDIYIADRPHPQYYHPGSPFDALDRHRRIYLLTHPRQWETNWRENTKDNLLRMVEGLTW